MTVTAIRALAPAKINLGLFVGSVREMDCRHELVSVMQSISLADQLTLEPIQPGGLGEDEIVCPGVPGDPGENLAARALRSFREETGWDPGPLRLTIVKRIPVAAGLGGGSSDAAATLRLARHASGIDSARPGDEVERLLLRLAARLGADVPAQIAPGRWLATGAGERLHPLPAPIRPFGVLLLPVAAELSTAAVYRQADRLAGASPPARARGEERGHVRTRTELHEIDRRLRIAYALGPPAPDARELLHNDLQPAAISLCAQIEPALAQGLDAGADAAFVSGSGPTVVALFTRANGPQRARRAADGLSERTPAPICVEPVDAQFAQAHDIDVRHNQGR